MNEKELAKKEYVESEGKIKLKTLAEKYSVSEGTIRSWKSRENWDKEVEKKVQRSCNEISKNVATKWDDLKRDWLSNDYEDLREFAEKHNLAYGSGNFVKHTTGWTTERQERRKQLNEKVVKYAEKEIEDELTKINRRHIDVASKILDKATEALGELNKYVVKLRTGYGSEGFDEKYVVNDLAAIDVKKILDITKALEGVQKIQRTALGISTTPEKGGKVDSEIKQSVKDMSDEELRRLADE